MSTNAATVPNPQTRIALRRNRTRDERRRARAKARSRSDGGEKATRRCPARAARAAGRSALLTLAGIELPRSPMVPVRLPLRADENELHGEVRAKQEERRHGFASRENRLAVEARRFQARLALRGVTTIVPRSARRPGREVSRPRRPLAQNWSRAGDFKGLGAKTVIGADSRAKRDR